MQWVPCFSILLILIQGQLAQEVGDTEKMYEWAALDYDWETDQDREDAIANGTFIIENNVICGIKLYQGEVYVTAPRFLPGVPSTVNKIIMKEGVPVLQPWPSWEMQELDNCDAFQFIQSMEIVGNQMWAIDSGRRNTESPGEAVNLCPPKLFIVNMDTGGTVHRYEFPDEVLSHADNFFNDIVVDVANSHAYMSDSGFSSEGYPGGIIVYDRVNDRSRRMEHPSMNPEIEGMMIDINGQEYFYPTPSNGIALSPDGEDLFYCPLGGYHLWRLPSEIARDFDIEDIDPYVQDMGAKVSQTDGMTMGHQNLYHGALSMNSVYMWEYQKDLEEGDGNWTMNTVTFLARDDAEMIWTDTFAWGDDGWLWYTANKLALFFANELDFTEPNFFVWRVFVDDRSYLWP